MTEDEAPEYEAQLDHEALAHAHRFLARAVVLALRNVDLSRLPASTRQRITSILDIARIELRCALRHAHEEADRLRALDRLV